MSRIYPPKNIFEQQEREKTWINLQYIQPKTWQKLIYMGTIAAKMCFINLTFVLPFIYESVFGTLTKPMHMGRYCSENMIKCSTTESMPEMIALTIMKICVWFQGLSQIIAKLLTQDYDPNSGDREIARSSTLDSILWDEKSTKLWRDLRVVEIRATHCVKSSISKDKVVETLKKLTQEHLCLTSKDQDNSAISEDRMIYRPLQTIITWEERKRTICGLENNLEKFLENTKHIVHPVK